MEEDDATGCPTIDKYVQPVYLFFHFF